MNTLDKFQGSLVGLALGDALGAPMEFTFGIPDPPVTDMQINTMLLPFLGEKTPRGYWTDDTSMALCSAYSLIKKGRFDRKDQMMNFLKWYREGFFSSTGSCFDIGNTIRSSLIEFEATKEVNQLADPYDNNLGNGSLMRLSPIPLFFYKQPKSAIKISGSSSLMTHKAGLCAEVCRCMAAFIVACFSSTHMDDLMCTVGDYSSFYYPSVFRDLLTWLKDPYDVVVTKPKVWLSGTGHVLLSFHAAIWAFFTTDNFRDGCIKAVNLGGDTDTYGAIYGQLAGVYYGFDHIKEYAGDWLHDLVDLEMIKSIAEQLYSASTARSIDDENL